MKNILFVGKSSTPYAMSKIVRKYYKTVPAVTQTFVQPTLTANGTMGGDSFACSANAETPASNAPMVAAYRVFDNDDTTYWRSGTSTGWIAFYNPNRLKVQKINWLPFHSYPKTGTVQGSNDGSSWEDLCSFTASSLSAFDINVNSQNYYKYHRINITSVNKDVIHAYELKITATEMTSPEHEIEVGASDEYDRYEDVIQQFCEVKQNAN